MKKIHFEGRTYEGMMTSYENLKERYDIVHLRLIAVFKSTQGHCGYFEVSLKATRSQTQRLNNVERRLHACLN